jgi:hypothetical protein
VKVKDTYGREADEIEIVFNHSNIDIISVGVPEEKVLQKISEEASKIRKLPPDERVLIHMGVGPDPSPLIPLIHRAAIDQWILPEMEERIQPRRPRRMERGGWMVGRWRSRPRFRHLQRRMY